MTPILCWQVRSDQLQDLTQRSDGRSKCKGESAGIVLGPIELKLGRHFTLMATAMFWTLDPESLGPLVTGERGHQRASKFHFGPKLINQIIFVISKGVNLHLTLEVKSDSSLRSVCLLNCLIKLIGQHVPLVMIDQQSEINIAGRSQRAISLQLNIYTPTHLNTTQEHISTENLSI